MPKFRKKPIVVEAFQVPPEGEKCSEEMCQFFFDSLEDIESPGDGSIFIHTRIGRMEARPGDWICKNVKGELYPCKDSIFTATYDEVETE